MFPFDIDDVSDDAIKEARAQNRFNSEKEEKCSQGKLNRAAFHFRKQRTCYVVIANTRG